MSLAALALSLSLAAGPGPKPASPPAERTPDQVLEQVRAANATLKTWSARFLERRLFVHFNESETKSGTISFKRGAGIRVEVQDPEPELIVARSDQAAQWLPRTRQFHRYRFAATKGDGSSSPIPFRFGDRAWDPRKDHDLRLVPAEGPEVGLELSARDPGAAYVKKTLWLDPKTWLPVRLQLVESTDDQVTFVFSDVKVDPPLEDSLFQLATLAGADVIDHSEAPSF